MSAVRVPEFNNGTHVCERNIELQFLTIFTNKTVPHFGIDDFFIPRIVSYGCFKLNVAIHTIETDEPSIGRVIEHSLHNDCCVFSVGQPHLNLNFGFFYRVRDFAIAAVPSRHITGYQVHVSVKRHAIERSGKASGKGELDVLTERSSYLGQVLLSQAEERLR